MDGGRPQLTRWRLQAVLFACLLVCAVPASAKPVAEDGLKGAKEQKSKKLPSHVRQQWPLRAIRTNRLRRKLDRRLAPVIVATVDSGADLTHPDLRGSFWRNRSAVLAPQNAGIVRRGAAGWDLLSLDAKPNDAVGHGTAVAGLIAARRGNGGINGVAPNARLMPMKACWRPAGGELTCTDDGSAAAIDWAAQRGARIIHLSWTKGGGPLVTQAIAAHPNILFVTDSGNGGGIDIDQARINCTIPAANLICVAASDRSGGPAECTSIGPSAVDVGAPGTGVATTVLAGRFLVGSPCAVSFAGPHVSGLAAILRGAVPRARAQTVKAAILQGTRPSPGFIGETVSGGIIDAPRSLQLLRGWQKLGLLSAPPD